MTPQPLPLSCGVLPPCVDGTGREGRPVGSRVVGWVPGLGSLQEEGREEQAVGTPGTKADGLEACGAWRVQVSEDGGGGWGGCRCRKQRGR